MTSVINVKRGERVRNTFVVVWDNVVFPHSSAVTDWLAALPRMSVFFLPPYLPFLNPTEKVFWGGGGSARRWKVYDHSPHDHLSSLESIFFFKSNQCWIRLSKRFFRGAFPEKT